MSDTKAEMTREEWEEWFRKNPPPSFESLQKRPKALLLEVSPRTYEAAKANPQDVMTIAKDVAGNKVIDRAYRAPEKAISVDTRGGSAVGAMKWGGNPMPGHGSVWQDREGRGDALVRRNYDIFAVLREDD
jgi:hypothetical protein